MEHRGLGIFIALLLLLSSVAVSQDINLNGGWNLVSFVRDPNIVLDAIAPEISYSNDSDESGITVNRSWIYVNITQYDANYSETVFRLYNATVLVNETRRFNSSATSVNWSGLANGTHFYNVTAYDMTWNRNSTETRNITLYSLPPQWHPEFRIDSENGSRPRLFYSPEGKLWAFYSIDDALNYENLMLRKRDGETFDNETFVLNKLRFPFLIFESEDNVTLSAETGGSVFILNTTNGGESWNMMKFYAANDGSYCSARMGSAISIEEEKLNVFYNYVYFNGVFGCVTQLYRANRTNGTWADSGTYMSATGSKYVTGAWQEEDTVVAIAGGIHRSENNGENFTQINSTTIGGISGVRRIENGTIYAVRSYTYGVEPDDKHVGVYTSDDLGTTWELITSLNSSDEYYMPCIGVGDGIMGLAYARRDGNDIYNISAQLSFDWGETWTDEETVVEVPGGFQVGHPFWNDMDIQLFDCAAYGDRFTLAYYLANESEYDSRYGVYLKEYY